MKLPAARQIHNLKHPQGGAFVRKNVYTSEMSKKSFSEKNSGRGKKRRQCKGFPELWRKPRSIQHICPPVREQVRLRPNRSGCRAHQIRERSLSTEERSRLPRHVGNIGKASLEQNIDGNQCIARTVHSPHERGDCFSIGFLDESISVIQSTLYEIGAKDGFHADGV